MRLVLHSAEQTRALGAMLGALCSDRFTLLLEGELGSGKTCFVQGIAVGCGVPENQPVSSPTYTLMNHYVGRCDLYHFDLYRLEGMADLDDLGFDDIFTGPGIKLIEWSGLLDERDENGLHIRFEYGSDEEERLLVLTPFGPVGAHVLERLADAWRERTHATD